MSAGVKSWLCNLAAGLLLLLVAMTFLFIWPGVLRYSYFDGGVNRVDRLLNNYQCLDTDGRYRNYESVK